MISGQRETGIVAAYDPKRGYGFITPSDNAGADIYVHWTWLRETGLDGLQPGQAVKYVRHRSGRGWCASRVRLMTEGAAA